MKWYLSFLLLFVCCCYIPLAVAETSEYTFQKNTPIEITRPCINNGTWCSSVAACNITASYPNGTILVNNNQMTNQISYHNYTIPSTDTEGQYKIIMTCTDNGLNGANTFYFDINPTGIPASDQKTDAINFALIFIFILGTILFLSSVFANVKAPAKMTFLIVAIIFFMIGINMISLTLSDAVVNPTIEGFFDSFAAISWYAYWFGGAFLCVMWLFTFLNTYFYNKSLRRIEKFGG